jgi:restriction system protein
MKKGKPLIHGIPQFHSFFNPVLRALIELGGSGSIEEINSRVIGNLRLSDEVLTQLHNPEIGGQTEVEYRLAWARTYLKKFGLINNSIRGVWSLTENAEGVHEIDPDHVVKAVRETNRQGKNVSGVESPSSLILDEELVLSLDTWKSELHKILTEELTPAAFERLVQRILRESGFVQVEVLGRTGDGGIDGKGIAKIHGLMSFHVIFQCKRYRGSVSSAEIRNFRGTMVGRADKGLFVTTGTFTRDAVKEATRDGASPIDLMDGDQLAEKLKELKLGVTTEFVENISVGRDWFRSI